MKHFILGLLLIGCTLAVNSQDAYNAEYSGERDTLVKYREIVSDRPAQSAASSTVPLRTLQIETGFIYEKTQTPESDIDNWFLGTTLLRYGLWQRFEVRAASYYQLTDETMKEPGNDTSVNGLGPLSLGFKVFVVKEKGLRPEISILAEMTLRHIGSPAYHPTYSYPVAKLAATHTLTPNLSLGYNAGFGYNGENPDGFFVYSVVLAYKISQRISFYGEAYGTFDNGNLPNHRMDGGFTLLLSNNLQIDISGGTGFDRNIDKSFISTGLSWRIPH